MSLLRIVPRPAPVTLGGRAFLAAEFRLSDLADLHAWAGSLRPDPYDSLAFRLELGPRDREWKQLLSDLIDRADDTAATFAAAIESEAGVARQAWLSLRRHSPDLREAPWLALLAAARASSPISTELELRRILRVAWAVSADDMIRRMIDGPTPGTDPDWPALYHRYITTVTGPAPAFADLTIGQLRAWLAAGAGPDEDRADFAEVAVRRAEFFAELG